MKNLKFIFVIGFVLLLMQTGFSQEPSKTVKNAPKTSENVKGDPSVIESNRTQTSDTPREKRSQAYAKLLEGQRYIWSIKRLRSQSVMKTGARLAKDSLEQAVELDPTLAEGYTALAELSYQAPPYDVEEAIKYANTAIKIDPNNFGAHKILARLYTFNSQLNRGILDKELTEKAITEWTEVVRLDPRNAEGYAFLSEFYDRTGKSNERIQSLRNWLSAATPIETEFYRRIMGPGEQLSPENASVKLGSALIKAGSFNEAVSTLSNAVADSPENEEAIELLSRALESSDTATSTKAIESLQQAVFANPDNLALVTTLAQLQVRSGNLDAGAKILRDSIAKLIEVDKSKAANLQVALGDIYQDVDRYEEAIANYKTALAIQGIKDNTIITDEQRDFAMFIYEKLIQTYKNANRPNDVRDVINKARLLFGDDDLFADKMQISFFRENGKKKEALNSIRALRTKFPGEFSLLQLEADILTEYGRIDEAVALYKNLIAKKDVLAPANANLSGSVDEFTVYLFISSLYSQAKLGDKAIESAERALLFAQGAERKQIAQLTLATALQVSGDFLKAEKTLREILREMPRNPIALNNLGYFLLERDEKIPEALELIQKAVDIDPTNSSYLDSLGWAYFKSGDLNLAEKYLKSAAKIDASSTAILEHLGDVYQKQGKIALAKSFWNKALKISSNSDEINRLKSKLNLNNSK